MQDNGRVMDKSDKIRREVNFLPDSQIIKYHCPDCGNNMEIRLVMIKKNIESTTKYCKKCDKYYPSISRLMSCLEHYPSCD